MIINYKVRKQQSQDSSGESGLTFVTDGIRNNQGSGKKLDEVKAVGTKQRKRMTDRIMMKMGHNFF